MINMKFIHAVVFDVDEFNNGHYNTNDWGDLCDGDYVVHCLYDVDNEHIVIHEDNCHAPVETMIESFLEGIRYANSIDVGGLMVETAEIDITKAYIVVDNGLSYDKEAVTLCLVEGAYAEVID
jgi:hypothetical protein